MQPGNPGHAQVPLPANGLVRSGLFYESNRHIEREGAQGFALPEFYEGFLTQFQQLRDLLHAGQQARLGQE